MTTEEKHEPEKIVKTEEKHEPEKKVEKGRKLQRKVGREGKPDEKFKERKKQLKDKGEQTDEPMKEKTDTKDEEAQTEDVDAEKIEALEKEVEGAEVKVKTLQKKFELLKTSSRQQIMEEKKKVEEECAVQIGTLRFPQSVDQVRCCWLSKGSVNSTGVECPYSTPFTCFAPLFWGCGRFFQSPSKFWICHLDQNPCQFRETEGKRDSSEEGSGRSQGCGERVQADVREVRGGAESAEDARVPGDRRRA